MTVDLSSRLLAGDSWIACTCRFFLHHFWVIMTLGLIAGIGRSAQEGGFGYLSVGSRQMLELLVEGARVFLLVYVLGLANLPKGLRRISDFLAFSELRKHCQATVLHTLKNRWKGLLTGFAVFLIISWLVNWQIEMLVYKTSLLTFLKNSGMLVESSSEWPLLLLLKNVTVIQFSIVANAMLALWLVNKHPMQGVSARNRRETLNRDE